MKIFLAGGEPVTSALTLQAAGYPFRLVSYFMLKSSPKSQRVILECAEQALGSEWIMDSGLFSFMFGSSQNEASTPVDYDGFKRYATEYIQAMQTWGWKHALVECDVQRLLGADANERLREEVFRQSGMEVIYVWHLPDGERGLIELARREKRIALSIPELRQVLANGASSAAVLKKAVIHLLRVIRSSGATPRVHLLGNTDVALCTVPADSCDSTSWKTVNQYGSAYDVITGKQSLSKYSPRWSAWRRHVRETYAQAMTMLRPLASSQVQWTYIEHELAAIAVFNIFMERSEGRNCRLTMPNRLPVSGDEQKA